MEHGNLTTYEWIHGEAPLRIEEPDYDFGAEDCDDIAENINVELDFDCIDVNPKDDQITDVVELDAPAEIDWGDLEIVDDTASNIEIDWENIDGLDQKNDDIDIVIEESGVEGGVARGNEALSILDNRRTRNLILDELYELEAFFVQRIVETHSLEHGGKGNIFALTGINANSDLVNNEKAMNDILSCVRSLINQLTSGQIYKLQLVRSSPKHVDRLVDDLKQKLRFVDRCLSKNVELATKREAAIQEQAEAQRKLKVRMKYMRLGGNFKYKIITWPRVVNKRFNNFFFRCFQKT